MDAEPASSSGNSRDDYVFPPAPNNAASLSPTEARVLFRQGNYRGPTEGFCAGYVQTGIAIIPQCLAGDFEEFCRRNSAALPVIYRSQPGEITTSLTSDNSDIRTDLPRYRVYSKGRIVDDRGDILGFSFNDCTTFYIGSISHSTTMEEEEKEEEDLEVCEGLELRDVSEEVESVYLTNIATHSVGDFSGPMTVTMRPFPHDKLEKVFEMTAQYPNAHGAPVHIGDPSKIGVDLGQVQLGSVDAVEVKNGEVPMFWACNLTTETAIANAKTDLAFTNYPGCMFITDQLAVPKPLSTQHPKLIKISREGAPQNFSVIGENVYDLFPRLEEALLEDGATAELIQLFQESDLLQATLVLSHSSHVAVTTGFPCLPHHEIKEGTDGLPGALAVAQALLTLGKKVSLIVDCSNAVLFNLISDYVNSISGNCSKIPLLLLDHVREKMREKENDKDPPFDCLLAVGRIARNKDGVYLSRKEENVSKYVDPIDSLFEEALNDSRVTTIAIVTSAREIGAGKMAGEAKKLINREEEEEEEEAEEEGEGEGVVASDCLIAVRFANSGGHALAAGLYSVSQCPIHWRYRNRGINAETPPTLDINNFINSEMFSSILQYMNSVEVRDGVTGSLDQSVGGVSLSHHLDKLQQIRDIALLADQD